MRDLQIDELSHVYGAGGRGSRRPRSCNPCGGGSGSRGRGSKSRGRGSRGKGSKSKGHSKGRC